jgi:hypothetical protein
MEYEDDEDDDILVVNISLEVNKATCAKKYSFNKVVPTQRNKSKSRPINYTRTRPRHPVY